MISLGLEKRPSVLNELTLLEMVPEERIKALLKSPFLLPVWEENDEYKQKYANEIQQIIQ